jgi:predicted metal-dependent enzyme (double-stranded beta helix superfamily)
MKGSMLAAVVMGAAAYASTVLATPPAGFTSTTLARGRYGDIDVHNVSAPPDYWQAKLKTHRASDLYVQSNVWTPGGNSGWHTHPGHSMITVLAGTVTAYEGDDPTCTPKVYTVGMGFVDPGGDHVHVLRNEGAVEARTITVQLIPADAPRRIDVPDPGNCSF